MSSPPSPAKPTTTEFVPPLMQASTAAKSGDHETALSSIQEYLAPYSKAVSVEALQAAATAVRLCNELALTCMRDAASPAQLDAAYNYLKWALKAPHTSPALRAVTFNNAGIYYARTGQPQAALRCLERVGKQGGMIVEDDVSVHVKLNMTTVLADLGRHGEALEMAQEAVRALSRAERAGRVTDSSLLSAAYHNLAVQQERLGSTKGHVRSYRNAMLQARKAGAHPMQNFMEQAYTHARQRAVTTTPAGHGSPVRGAEGSSSSSGTLPPVGRAATTGGSRTPKLSGLGGSGAPKHAYGAPRARSGQSEGRRRQERTKPAPSPGAYVSLDDVYSGAVPLNADTVPVGGTGQGPALVPPPGVDASRDAGPVKRHAPRSAGSARVTASAYGEQPAAA